MRYINANVILPKELVEKLQDFVQGEYLYIPAIKDQHKNWGELSGFREEIDRRNSEIIQAYTSGTSIQELAESYCLSVYAIRKIIYNK
ncbi:CD3324 family protein [Paenibacillus ehimensis]|uniref:CD3324 family protein n=1 Tax=Paenibacillus ehimensis TaxID=79264 RepID=A0ABT8VKH0_9BACL|nr:CD3324 family protein [Paenibacillus ehimensis]MDO3681473.1 CD3324 family protein [Paenibacillus ehimensis]MEC0212037.1 CD3324 family protein [Paenibacillus ehimensis]